MLAIGLFPPPIDGQRLVTQSMFEEMSKVAVVERCSLDFAGGSSAGHKAFAAVRACMRLPLARLRGCSQVYLAPHSGFGLIYSAMIVAFGRLLGFGFNIHYHTYRSINRHSKLMALFTTLCGDHAVHIALASSMASALRRRYPAIKRIAAVSNAAFLPLPPAASSSKQREFCIGHLSNLSSAKGTDKVIDCFRALRSSGVQIDLLLAGPVSDSGTQKVLNDAIADLGEHVTYLGPVKRSELQDFYGRIDAFLFPSAYEHEAEPLVAIEALSFGVPVLATNRGCIEALLGADGLVFGQDEFVAEATRQITTWARSPDSLAAASERARGRFLEVKRDAQDALNTLLARMCTP